jgi:hypothetical protein
MDHRNDWLSLEALEDLDTMVEVLQEVVRKGELRCSRSTRRRAGVWRMPWNGPGLESKPRVGRFRGRKSTLVCALVSITTSCTSSGETLGPALCEQVGGKQCGLVSLPLPNAGDQRVGCRIGHTLEPIDLLLP